MGWVREREHTVLTQGFLERFGMMKSAGDLRQVGSLSLFRPGSCFTSQKKYQVVQGSPNAADADVTILFKMIYKQFSCKVL